MLAGIEVTDRWVFTTLCHPYLSYYPAFPTTAVIRFQYRAQSKFRALKFSWFEVESSQQSIVHRDHITCSFFDKQQSSPSSGAPAAHFIRLIKRTLDTSACCATRQNIFREELGNTATKSLFLKNKKWKQLLLRSSNKLITFGISNASPAQFYIYSQNCLIFCFKTGYIPFP